MSTDTVARIRPARPDGMLASAGPCKYPFVRLGECNKIHRVTRVILRWRLGEQFGHLPPVSLCIDCRPGFSASDPRVQLLTAADLPDDVSAFCSRCFGVRLPRCVVPPSREVAA